MRGDVKAQCISRQGQGRLVLVALAAILLVGSLVLVGLLVNTYIQTGDQTERLRTANDRAVDSVNLSSLGKIVLDESSGSVSLSSSPPERDILLLDQVEAGTPSSRSVINLLTASGFSMRSSSDCSLADPCAFARQSDRVNVSVILYKAGDVIDEPSVDKPKFHAIVRPGEVYTSLLFEAF